MNTFRHIPVRYFSLFLGFMVAFYTVLMLTRSGPFTVINNIRMNSFFCLSETKPSHLSDYSSENTQLRLVVAYMRGGSTLTADLVRHTERDFYVYEPLHGIWQAVKRNASIQFLNGTKRYISKGELDSVYTEMIYNWFTCNFQNIDIPGLTNPFIAIHTPEHRSYYACINPKNTSKTLIQRVEHCIPLLQVKCLNYNSRTIKTIRLPVEMAGKLLKWLPGMKFLYLVRDPRGIVNSQFEQLITEGKNVSTCAKELCQTISRDLEAFDDLARCHGSRMLSVVYENLCQNPIAMVHKIYNFFGNKYSKRVKDFVKRMMQGPVRWCDYCTERGNAVANAYRWISVIHKEDLHTIDSHCSFLYPYLGYKDLEYNKLNITKSSWTPNTGFTMTHI